MAKQERLDQISPKIPFADEFSGDKSSIPEPKTVLCGPGAYYFQQGSSEIRPEILEKQRQINQGKY